MTQATDFSKYFNPEVTHLNFRITVANGTAEDSGWEFSDLYEASRYRNIDTFDESEYIETYDQARERIRKEWSIEVHVIGEKTNPSVLYCDKSWWNGKMECGSRQESSDAEKTIEDIIDWIKNDLFEDFKDYSYENYGNTYQPIFDWFDSQK